jgi:hypothetical protein
MIPKHAIFGTPSAKLEALVPQSVMTSAAILLETFKRQSLRLITSSHFQFDDHQTTGAIRQMSFLSRSGPRPTDSFLNNEATADRADMAWRKQFTVTSTMRTWNAASVAHYPTDDLGLFLTGTLCMQTKWGSDDSWRSGEDTIQRPIDLLELRLPAQNTSTPTKLASLLVQWIDVGIDSASVMQQVGVPL